MISPKVSISKALCMALSSRRSGGKGCCGNNPGHHAGVGELNQNLSRRRQRKGPDCCTRSCWETKCWWQNTKVIRKETINRL